MKKYIIAIDPDCYMSGVATLNTELRAVTDATTMDFPSLLGHLRFAGSTLIDDTIIIIEAGYKNKPNFHKGAQTLASAAQVGMRIGANHQVGKLITEMARSYGLEVIEQMPLRKLWKATDGKISHDELAYFVKGQLPTRTNQEQRDAVLLAWTYVGYPIKIKPRP